MHSRSALTGKGVTFYIFVYTLFSFKWDLIGAGGSGLRLDDLLLSFVVLNAFRRGFPRSALRLPAAMSMSCLVAVHFASAIANADDVALWRGFLFALRPAEYAVFLLIGFEMGYRHAATVWKVLDFYTVYLFGLCVLQLGGLVGGSVAFTEQRAAGNLGGPYELAVVASFLCIGAVTRGKGPIALLALACVIMSESRITSVALLMVMVPVLVRRLSRSQLKRVAVTIGGGALLTSALVGTVTAVPGLGDLTDRLRSTNIVDSWALAGRYADSIGTDLSPAEYMYFTHDRDRRDFRDLSGDASSLSRFTRWRALLGIQADDPLGQLIGIGPGYGGFAVDGSYVRLWIETGLLGAVSFSAWLLHLWKTRVEFFGVRSYLVVLLITGLSIDIWYTYKPMALLWFILGLSLAFERRDGYGNQVRRFSTTDFARDRKASLAAGSVEGRGVT